MEGRNNPAVKAIFAIWLKEHLHLYECLSPRAQEWRKQMLETPSNTPEGEAQLRDLYARFCDMLVNNPYIVLLNLQDPAADILTRDPDGYLVDNAHGVPIPIGCSRDHDLPIPSPLPFDRNAPVGIIHRQSTLLAERTAEMEALLKGRNGDWKEGLIKPGFVVLLFLANLLLMPGALSQAAALSQARLIPWLFWLLLLVDAVLVVLAVWMFTGSLRAVDLHRELDTLKSMAGGDRETLIESLAQCEQAFRLHVTRGKDEAAVPFKPDWAVSNHAQSTLTYQRFLEKITKPKPADEIQEAQEISAEAEIMRDPGIQPDAQADATSARSKPRRVSAFAYVFLLLSFAFLFSMHSAVLARAVNDGMLAAASFVGLDGDELSAPTGPLDGTGDGDASENRRIEIQSAEADSVLTSSKGVIYGAALACDGDVNTSWQEGASGTGEGKSITFSFAKPVTVSSLVLVTGNAKSESSYVKNNRFKTITLIFSDGSEQTIQLKDEYDVEGQHIVLEKAVKMDRITLVIGEVYRGESFNDTCLSEVAFYR